MSGQRVSRGIGRRWALTGYSKLCLQFGNPFEQLGQLLQSDHLPFGLAIRLRWRPDPFLAVRNVVHDTGLCADGHAVANFQVAGKAYLPAEDDVVAEFCASGNSRLRDNQAMLSQGHVVADLDKVIYFAAAANNRRPEGAPINCYVCADFDVVADDNIADLGHLAVKA